MALSFCQFLVLLFSLLLTLPSFGQVSQNLLDEEQPQWEAGVGVITLNIPDYPGSNNNRVRILPFPYYIYRGKYFRADDEGTRARLLSSKRHETGMSFGINFPVKSNDNPSRVGMPDLDALVSFGPRLLFRFLTDVPKHKLNLSFATRAVFSTKFSFNNLFKAEGLSFEPRVNYWYRFLDSGYTVFTTLGVEFGSAKYARYFYDVSPNYVTASRPRFDAHAGLIETSIAAGFGKELSRTLFLFAGASMRNLDWATNKDSPLVESRNNTGFLVGLVWTLIESDEKVVRL